jgi:hypothetical protein
VASEGRVHPHGLDARGLLQLAGEGLLLGRVGNLSEPAQVRVEKPGSRLVDQDLVVAGLDGDLSGDARLSAAPSATLRRRSSTSCTPFRSKSRAQIQTLAWSGTTFGTSPPSGIT